MRGILAPVVIYPLDSVIHFVNNQALVVTTRLHRKYFKDGRQHVSPEVSSVYCHVNLYCVTAAFLGFQPSLCQVPSDLVPFLLPEHKATAITRLGVSF